MNVRIKDNVARIFETVVSEKSVNKVENVEIEKNKGDKIITQIGEPNFDNLFIEIKKFVLDKQIALQLINLLQEAKQAKEDKDAVKQIATKEKLSRFWLSVGSTVQKVLQSSAHFTTILKNLGIELY